MRRRLTYSTLPNTKNMKLTVEVLNTNALNLLSDMEYLDLIRLNTPMRTAAISSEKLSSKFAGPKKHKL